MADEVPLQGGRLTAGVVRVGDTVRRPIGLHSARAHDALRRLEAVGFEEAPRFLGIDEEGREILTYAPGVMMWPGAPHLLHTDRTIDRAGAMIRRLHDALPGMVHGDLGAWNLIVELETDRWTIIDWDEVDERPPTEDIAQALLSFCDLWQQVCPEPAEAVRRARRFVAAYRGDDDSLLEALRAIPRICERNARAMARRGMHDDAAMWQGHADHVDAQLPMWLGALSRPSHGRARPDG